MRNNRIDAFRGLMMVFVVGIHAFGYAELEGRTADITWYITSTIATAGFFAADGYLLAANPGRINRPLLYILRQDAIRLMLPWAAFSILYVAVQIGAEMAGWARPLFTARSGIDVIPELIWQSVAAPQLYFLPALLLVRLAFHPFASTFRELPPGLIWLPVLYLTVYKFIIEPWYLATWPPMGIDPLLQAMRGFGFFWLGFHATRISGATVKRSCMGFIIPTGLLWLFAPEALHLFAQISFLGLVATVFLRWQALSIVPLVRLGQQTMPVFLLHAPITLKIATFLVPSGLSPLLTFVGLVTASILASLMIAILIRATGQCWLFGEGKPAFLSGKARSV